MKKDISFIPYNANLKDYAKENRKNQTKAESLLWNLVLKNKQLQQYKFRRQKVISSFILDFYCPKLLLWIEIDGAYHDEVQDYDNERELVIAKYGIKIIRFTNDEVEKNLEWVIIALKQAIEERVKEIH